MTQRIMMANEEIEDHSMDCSLTPKECVSAISHQEWEQFLETIQGRWGQKRTVKDWGPDVINLVLIQRTTIPTKMMMGPHSTNWMMSLLLPKWLGISLSTLRCFSALGTPRNLQGSASEA